jgi:hypothetical protein
MCGGSFSRREGRKRRPSAIDRGEAEYSLTVPASRHSRGQKRHVVMLFSPGDEFVGSLDDSSERIRGV